MILEEFMKLSKNCINLNNLHKNILICICILLVFLAFFKVYSKSLCEKNTIAAGAYHSLALKSDGSLVAWGDNTFGQCDVPSRVDFVYISAGAYHSVAIRSDGTISAWGDNSYNQCAVPTEKGFIAVTADSYHNVALRSDGLIITWGKSGG